MENLTHDHEVLGRLGERLRSMSEASLVRARVELDGASLAGTVHTLCSWAAAEMGVDAPVPVLHPLASGDQLVVVGREFLGWAEESGASALTGWREAVDRLRRAA